MNDECPEHSYYVLMLLLIGVDMWLLGDVAVNSLYPSVSSWIARSLGVKYVNTYKGGWMRHILPSFFDAAYVVLH
jgi:hypothetical protein